MSGISPISIQHIQQMGTATEKLQHALQNIPNAAGEQHKEERKVADEIKRTTVQKGEESNQSNTVNPDGSRRKQAGKQNNPTKDQENTAITKGETETPENGAGRTINLRV
jgi:hypothetical protein